MDILPQDLVGLGSRECNVATDLFSFNSLRSKRKRCRLGISRLFLATVPVNGSPI